MIKLKGYTSWAVGLSVANISKALLGNMANVQAVSTIAKVTDFPCWLSKPFFLFLTSNVSTFISVEGGKVLSRSLNDKIPKIWCLGSAFIYKWQPITCFRHNEILAKTRSRLATATTFSRQNDVSSRACPVFFQPLFLHETTHETSVHWSFTFLIILLLLRFLLKRRIIRDSGINF